jgi:hypothetical protein
MMRLMEHLVGHSAVQPAVQARVRTPAAISIVVAALGTEGRADECTCCRLPRACCALTAVLLVYLPAHATAGMRCALETAGASGSFGPRFDTCPKWGCADRVDRDIVMME